MSLKDWLKWKLFNAEVLAIVQKASPMPGDLLHLQVVDGDPEELLEAAKLINKKYNGQIMVMFSMRDGLNISTMDLEEIRRLRDRLSEHLEQHDGDEPGRVDG